MKKKLLFNIALGVGFALTLSSCDKNFSSGAYTSAQESTPTSGEKYSDITENIFINTTEQPISTFSIDADGGSYSNVRRMINEGHKPTINAIRIEEMINYFDFDYEGNSADNIAVNGEVSDCPWAAGHKLIRIGIKGQENAVPNSNLVLLIDVSGSMSDYNKLDLLKKSFAKLVERLDGNSKIAIVTYSEEVTTVLNSTYCSEKNTITSAINKLKANGSTNGGKAIQMAYDLATANYIPGANNRIILATDGDFNVGITDRDELIKFIEEKRKTGIFLTTIGVGMGNYNEANMEGLADHGNGTYEYIDSEEQGERVFVTNFNRLFTIAKDVKVQVLFDSTTVQSYRLIGYENRLLQTQDFDDDSKDAGDLGMGQSVTALYEVVPKENLKVHRYFIIDFRYKKPNEEESKKIEMAIFNKGYTFEQSSEHMRFAAAVAGFGMLLKGSQFKGDVTYDKVIEWTDNTSDNDGSKQEFIELVHKAKNL